MKWYLLLISYYSQAQIAQQELLMSIFNLSVIALKHCTYFSCCMSPTCKLSSKFLEAQSVACVFL